MQYLTLLLAATVLVSPMRAETSVQRQETVTSMEELNSHMTSVREFVQQLVKDNLDVMSQVDVFAQALQRIYVAGEGLIDKDVHRILNSVAFAAEKHRFQTRKDSKNTPYIIHPIRVANSLVVIGHVSDPDIIIAALLHDTVEDTKTTFEELEEVFGQRITGFVREVTDDKSLPKEVRKLLQIEHAPHKSAGAAQIKLADKFDNLNSILDEPPAGWEQSRVVEYFAWAKRVVDKLPWVNAALKEAVEDAIKAYEQSL